MVLPRSCASMHAPRVRRVGVTRHLPAGCGLARRPQPTLGVLGRQEEDCLATRGQSFQSASTDDTLALGSCVKCGNAVRSLGPDFDSKWISFLVKIVVSILIQSGARFWSKLGSQFWSKVDLVFDQSWRLIFDPKWISCLIKVGGTILIQSWSRFWSKLGLDFDPKWISFWIKAGGHNFDPKWISFLIKAGDKNLIQAGTRFWAKFGRGGVQGRIVSVVGSQRKHRETQVGFAMLGFQRWSRPDLICSKSGSQFWSKVDLVFDQSWRLNVDPEWISCLIKVVVPI